MWNGGGGNAPLGMFLSLKHLKEEWEIELLEVNWFGVMEAQRRHTCHYADCSGWVPLYYACGTVVPSQRPWERTSIAQVAWSVASTPAV
jgi:hypothetical protein